MPLWAQALLTLAAVALMLALVAAGLKKGIDVFVQRLRKAQGDNHE